MSTDSGSSTRISAAASLTPHRESGDAAVRDWKFWLIMLSLMLSTFIFALEAVAVGNALPAIVHRFHSTQFVWVGSAYSLAACAFLPLTGAVAQIFGRRAVMFSALAFFAIGSAVCGAASSMNIFIAGRIIQGVGGGGITSISQIILSDLVPLCERGTFSGLLAIAFTIASCIGPVVAGSFAQRGQWRWIFYLNIPICAVTGILTLAFLKLKTPSGSMRAKLKSIDLIGNILIVASTTAIVIGLTWGGIQYSWSSAEVVTPLVLGLVGLCTFYTYEATLAATPMIILITTAYYLPVYFQACKGASPIASGVDVFGLAGTAAPMAVVAGLTITKSARYRPQIWFAWALSTIGCGLLSLLDADSSRAKAIGYQVLVGFGLGIVYVGTYFPILAPFPVTESTRALALFVFFRNFAAVWGITIGGSILQNELRKRLPAKFSSTFTDGTQIAYAVIPQIPDLPQPLKDEVRRAFADSVRLIWQVLTGISGLGFLVSLVMKGLPLHTSTDEEWGMQERKDSDVEVKESEKSDILTPVNNA
ncbi:hypothetical protein EVG20_g1500 [Dentipellis fragilis]|uniref:Major facilitator superfamily (MFS) profile domain-containing protein n=1 Tax=Dentipellis fragilis TaxID=205917 RepID=A0A4Y9ZDM4_9AGAM|nr:hypothetical protein EVG20_g1500 [Dentipellis fragilis]